MSIRVRITLTHSAYHARLHFPTSQFPDLSSPPPKYATTTITTIPADTTLSALSALLVTPFSLPLPLHGCFRPRFSGFGGTSPFPKLYPINSTTTIGNVVAELREEYGRSFGFAWWLEEKARLAKEGLDVELELATTAIRLAFVEGQISLRLQEWRWAKHAGAYLASRIGDIDICKENDPLKVDCETVRKARDRAWAGLQFAAVVLHGPMWGIFDRELQFHNDNAQKQVVGESKDRFAYLVNSPLQEEDVESWYALVKVYTSLTLSAFARLAFKELIPLPPLSEPLQPPPTPAEISDRDTIWRAQEILRNQLYSTDTELPPHLPQRAIAARLWEMMSEEAQRDPYISQVIIAKRKQQQGREEAERQWREKNFIDSDEEEEPYAFPTTGELNARVTFNLPSVEPKIALVPGTSFNVTTGALLWGQLHTLIWGSQHPNEFDGNAETVPEPLTGGTILQRVFRNRCAARNGRWGIWRAFNTDLAPGEGGSHIGWVICHEDVEDPGDLLRRAAGLTEHSGGISQNSHIDKDILYINRYDWSHHAAGLLNNTVREYLHNRAGLRILPPPPPKSKSVWPEYCIPKLDTLSHRWGGYFCAVDAGSFTPGVIEAIIRAPMLPDDWKGEGAELVFRHNWSKEDKVGEEKDAAKLGQAESTFGAYVALPSVEYELGWMVFSGKKHETYTNADELIGVVYDAAYDGLQSMSYECRAPQGNPFKFA